MATIMKRQAANLAYLEQVSLIACGGVPQGTVLGQVLLYTHIIGNMPGQNQLGLQYDWGLNTFFGVVWIASEKYFTDLDQFYEQWNQKYQ